MVYHFSIIFIAFTSIRYLDDFEARIPRSEMMDHEVTCIITHFCVY